MITNTQLYCEQPWKRIRFKDDQGIEHDGYIYSYVFGAGWMYVSQNNTPETIGKAQNWIIADHQIVKHYD